MLLAVRSVDPKEDYCKNLFIGILESDIHLWDTDTMEWSD